MLHSRSAILSLALAVCGAAALVHATPAAARQPRSGGGAKSEAGKGEGHACGVAFENAEQSEKAGQLRHARDLWAACARPTCIPFLRQECTTRYTQLDADIPTVVPVVTDEEGNTPADVRVMVDGEVLTNKLDGRALQVDPGMHEFVFKTAGAVVVQKIMIMQGQRNRPLAISLGSPEKSERAAPAADAPEPVATPKPVATERPGPAPQPLKAAPTKAKRKTLVISEDTPAPAPAAPPPAAAVSRPPAPPQPDDDDEPRSGVSPAMYVFGAAGLAALGASGLMIYWGRKDNDMLAQCSPGCPPNAVDHIRNVYRAADITLAVGVAALATSYLVYAITRSTKEKPRSSADEALLFDVAPTQAGAVAAVSGHF